MLRTFGVSGRLMVDLSRAGVAGFDAWWPERLAAWHGALPAATRDPLDKTPKPRV